MKQPVLPDDTYASALYTAVHIIAVAKSAVYAHVVDIYIYVLVGSTAMALNIIDN